MKNRALLWLAAVALGAALPAHAQSNKAPTSKLYVADTTGDSEIDTGTEIVDLTKKSVYNASGRTIQTRANSNASVVLSNGTGIYFDVNTRVEIKTFAQESFRPNRSDLEDEPSVSTTRIFVDQGVIGISTSKMVAGSTMTYQTSLATATIRGRQAVVLAQDDLTVISMVQGEATVQAGPLDESHLVRNHQQAIVRPGKTDERNIIIIQEIPDGADTDALNWLQERVLTADAARKLVYFEVQARAGGGNGGGGGGLSLFDGGSNDSGRQEIVAVPVVPQDPTVVAPVVSPANLTSR
jgi:hypothetical protein